MIYYGYKRGDDDKIVDWSSVTKSLTDRIDEVEAQRAANRERIEGEIADASQKIGDVPMGNYENMNSFMIQTSTDMAENLRVNSALLRAGKMKSSEFAKFTQNSLDAIGQYKKIAENYNSLRDKGVARLNEGKSGWQEAHELERLEKLADLTRTVSVQDPITGTMFNAPIGEDGRPDMSQAESTLYLANMPFVEMDKFDMNAQLDPTVEKYGKNVEVIKSLGVNTKSSIKIRKDFEDSVNTFLGSFDSRQLASVLGDFIGGYKGTTDEDLAKSKPEEYILIGRDGSNGNFPTYKLTPEQETKAREAIKEQLYMKLDYVETPMATTGTSATERKAAEERKGSVKKAIADVNNLRKIFEAKTPEDVSQALSTYNDELKSVATEAGGEFIRAQVSGEGDKRKIEVVYRNKYGDILAEKVADIPDNFQDFVDAGGPTITGNRNLLTLRDEAMAEISDPSSLVRGDKGGIYEIKVIEERLPAVDTDATLSDIDKILEEGLDTTSYSNIFTTAYDDMKDAAEQVFESMGFEDYAISESGDNILISVNGYDIPPFAMNKSAYTKEGNKHDQRRTAFKKHIEKIYTALTTGKKIGGVKKTLAQLKAENPNMTLAELNELLKNQ